MPASGRVLVDTNVVVVALNDETAVKSLFAAANEVFVPAVVLGELYFGAAKSAKPTENGAKVDAAAARWTVIGIDVEAARVYGMLRMPLRAKAGHFQRMTSGSRRWPFGIG